MMSRVGLDIRMYQHTGIGTYLRGLLSGLSKTGLLHPRNFCLFGPEPPENYAALPQVRFRSKIYTVAEQFEYLRVMNRCRLWHAPHYNVPVFRGRVKRVVTIHDIIHWIYRREILSPLQRFYARTMLSRAVHGSDHVLAVSGKTRDDLIEHFGADPSRISVVHEGVDPSFQRAPDSAIEKIRIRYGLSDSYFLYVGMLKPHKNVLWLIDLFKRLSKNGGIRSKLVVVGRLDSRYPRGYEAYSNISTGGEVVHISNVSFEELRALYSGARALVHPSLYEGFGLTLLEAMACQTPVLAFRAGSIPEIIGDAGCLVLPQSEEEMTDALVCLETDERVRNDWVRRGSERVKKYSWEKTARDTAVIYEKVLGEKLPCEGGA